MEIYPRRDVAVTDCVTPYVLDIEMISESVCDPAGDPNSTPPIVAGPCAWFGRFKPVMFNIQYTEPPDTVNVSPTYSWVVTTGAGVIDAGDDTEGVEVRVTSEFVEIFDLEITVVSYASDLVTEVTTVYTKEIQTRLA